MLDERDLLKLRTGDRETWDKWFDVFYAIAYRAAPPTLSQEDREDVAMQAVTRLSGYTHKVTTTDALKALVSGISKNLGVSRIRYHAAATRDAHKTSSLDAAEGGSDWMLDGQLTPHELVAAAELATNLRSLLAMLPDPHGPLLEDRYVAGMDYKALAEKYAMSVDAVGVNLTRGRAKLKALLEKSSASLKEMCGLLR